MNDNIKAGAILSECGKYRYRLWRIWDEDRPPMGFCMQNPSTADASEDDPTIRRCSGFARREGCGGIVVCNVFAFRATDEDELLATADPVGPENWEWMRFVCNVQLGTKLVAAWGTMLGGKKRFRTPYLNAAHACMAQGAVCLGTTKDGQPRHPLYVRGDAALVKWSMPSY